MTKKKEKANENVEVNVDIEKDIEVEENESVELTKKQIREKECLTEDVFTRLYSYISILLILIETDKYSDEYKISHMVLLVDHMLDEVKRMSKYYETIEYFNGLEDDYRKILKQSCC